MNRTNQILHPSSGRSGRQTQIVTDLQSNINPQNCKQTLLEALARQMYDRRVVGKSQHRFSKRKSCPLVIMPDSEKRIASTGHLP